MTSSAVHEENRLPLFQTDPATVELTELSQLIWDELQLAAGNLSHPWSLINLASASTSGVFQRLLILREVRENRNALLLHTDVRSPKVNQILERGDVSGLFYAPEHRTQLTVRGQAFVHTDDAISEAQWQQTPPERYRNYLGVQPPGTPALNASTNLPAELQASGLTAELCSLARSQFAVIEILIDEIDVLWLRPSGNLRARFRCNLTSAFGQWLEP